MAAFKNRETHRRSRTLQFSHQCLQLGVVEVVGAGYCKQYKRAWRVGGDVRGIARSAGNHTGNFILEPEADTKSNTRANGHTSQVNAPVIDGKASVRIFPKIANDFDQRLIRSVT